MPETRPSTDDGTVLNRALWDVRARIHGSVATLDPLVVDWPYGGGPHRETVTGTYAEPGLALPAQECVQYPYSIGEVVTAAATAGLTVKHLGEHEAAEFDPRGIMAPGADGRYRSPFGDSHLPVLYSLRAVSPDSA
ncbi:hypothetical protein ACIPWI_13155 [Streptomyces sp. NPDC090046]|uniref:hypothetical protein n=1 Tax=Streptomyces sp. NPDC090046 TaxID=3365928 RepID=UPI00381D200B